MKSTLQPDLHLLLKAQGILRNRRTRAGNFLKQSRRLFNIKPIWNSGKFATWKSTTFGPNLNNLVQVKRQPQNLSTEKTLIFCLLNARSINNKSLQIKDSVVDRDIDILAVTETWLKADECCDYITWDVTSTGYTFVHSPRLNGIVGGVGMLYRTNLKVQQLMSDSYKSFEFKELLLHSDNCMTRIIIVFRPPISVKNGLTHAAFFDEFSMLLEHLASSPGNLLLNGDFNLHVNDLSDSTASQFLDLLNCFNLNIFNLCTPTHKNNNVLDLIITRSGETSVSNLSVHDPVMSDHFAVYCSLAIKKPSNVKLTVMTRKLCNIDSDSLCTDIRSSSLYNSPSLDLSELCDQYDSALSSILDKHAPLRKSVITIRPRAPWYSEEIKEQKVIFRRLERRWRRSRLTSDYQSYTDQRTVVKNTIFKSKMDYYSSLIYSAESDSKTLFRTITRLLHRKAVNLFPTSSSAVELANKFVHFFEEKIVNIRSNLGTPVIPDFFRTLDTSSLTCQLVNFAPTSNTELSNIANNIIMKSCILDPLPATLLKQHFDLLLPIILKTVNL